jgi:hypothetical protein
VLAAGGVAATTHEARPFLACFRRERDAAPLLAELEQICDVGQDVSFHPVTGWRARAFEPALTDWVGAAVQIHGQQYLSVPTEQMPAGPLYFRPQRVACTPLEGRMRVAILNGASWQAPMMARDRHVPIVEALERGGVEAARGSSTST